MKKAILLLIPILFVAGCIHSGEAGPEEAPAKLGSMSIERLGFDSDIFMNDETKRYRFSVENMINKTLAYRIEFSPEDASFLEVPASVSFDAINPQEKTVAKVVEMTAHTPVARAETLLTLRLYSINGGEELIEETSLRMSITKEG